MPVRTILFDVEVPWYEEDDLHRMLGLALFFLGPFPVAHLNVPSVELQRLSRTAC